MPNRTLGHNFSIPTAKTDSDSAPAPKRAKLISTERHSYANISIPEDDEEADKRNVASLKQEVLKRNSTTKSCKSLVHRTFPLRRRHILEDHPHVETPIEKFPHLKKTNVVSFYVKHKYVHVILVSHSLLWSLT